MTAKIQNKKTKRPKKPHEMTHVEKVAAVTGGSESMVGKVLRKQRSDATPLGESIWLAATLIEEKENLLLQEVKRIVKC